jgi:hypothetical protein
MPNPMKSLRCGRGRQVHGQSDSAALVLRDGEKARLEQWGAVDVDAGGVGVRARLVLLASEGVAEPPTARICCTPGRRWPR